MASLTLRSIKGVTLTNAELDANFTALNTELGQKLVASSNLSDLANAATARTNLGLGNVENKSSATIRGELTSLNVTTALGFTPYNATNPSGFITAGASITGNAATATALQTARTINGVSFDGSANITVADATKLPLSGGALTGPLTLNNVTKGNQLFTTSDAGNATLTIKGLNYSHAVFFNDSYNTGEYAKLSGGFTTQALLRLTGFSALNTASATSDYASNYASIAGTLSATGAITQAGNQVLHAANYTSYSPSLTGSGASGTWGISISGNAGSATRLINLRTINGVGFDGTANITVADATKLPLSGGTVAGVLIGNGGFANVDGGIRIANPGGASYATSASTVTGAIKIRLPAAALGSNSMISFRVRVYQYSTGLTQEFVIAGYNYSDAAGTWYNVSALNLSDAGGDFTVRFGKDATSQCVYIGELNSSWSYPQVHVVDFSAGYSGMAASTWATDWNISFETSAFAGVTSSRTAWRSLSAGNYNSYAPSLTGAGASGSWGISISGNAATATNGVVTTGSYADPAWLTSVNYSKLTGTVPTWNQNTTGSAATLATPRTINGTSFNGSANITTSFWGTGRTLTVGSTGKSVDGSANISWTLSEIGAAAASFVGSGQVIQNGVLSAYPEDGGFVHISSLYNDLAFTHMRGGSVAITKNGVTVVPDSTALTNSLGGGGVLSLSTGATTDTFVITVNAHKTFRYGNIWGITMGDSWRAKDVIIEVYFSGAWTTIHTVTNHVSGHVWKNYSGNNANDITAVRFTLTNLNSTSSLRISSIFAVGYISALGAESFLTRNGGNLYGTNAAPPALQAAGGDTNIDLDLRSKGTGAVEANGNVILHAANYNSYAPTLTGTGASGTWGISVTGTSSYSTTSGSASTATRSTIEDTRAAQRTPNAYDDYRASYEFTNQITGASDWHTAFTMQGWHDGYAAWQIIGPASTGAHENWYLRSGVNTSWNPLRTILHSGNYGSYSSFSGAVTSGGNNGFRNDVYYGGVRNPIWSFGNSTSYGISYFQGTAGIGGADTIGIHPNGTPTSGGSAFSVTPAASYVNSNVVLHAGNYNSYALPLSGGTLTGALNWAASPGLSNGNPRSLVTGYSGGNYGQTGYGISFTSTSGLHNYALNDIVSLWEAYDGLRVYAAAGGAVGSAITWTTVLDARRSNPALVFKGQTVLDAGNYNSYSPTLTGGGASGSWGISITGSSASTTGNAATATALQTARTINGVSFNGTADITVADSTKLPLSGGTLTGSTKIKAGHGNTRFQLHYNHDDADTTSGSAGYLTLWASEPGISYPYTGIGGNINLGGQYYGRATSGQAYGVYLRFETASGNSEFWNTTGAVGAIGGQGTRRAYIDANGDLWATSSAHKVLHAGNYSSYALPLSGGTLSGTLYVPKVILNANDDLSWGGTYGSGKPTIAATTSAIYFYPVGNAGSLALTISNSAINSSVALQQGGNQVLHAGNYTSYNGILRALGYPSSGNNWNALGNDYPNSVIQVTPDNFSSTANGPTAASYTYGTLLNFTTNSNSQSQIFISHAGHDLIFRGGWGGASWQTWNKVLTNQNYTSYSPSLTGSGASGTWGISVTGNAATVSGISRGVPGADLNTVTTSGFYRIQNTEANRPADYGQLLVIYGGSDTITQIYGSYSNGTLFTRSGNPPNVGGSGSWTSWRTLLDSSNYSSYALPLSGGQLSGDLQLSDKFLRFDQSGTRSWNVRATGGNLDVASGDGLGSLRYNGNAVLTAGNSTSYPSASAPLLSAVGSYSFSASTNGRDFGTGVQAGFVSDGQGYPSYGSVVRVKTYSNDGGTAELYFPYSSAYGGSAMRYRLGQYDNAGWTAWKTVLDSSNYTSYSPSLTGSGASGTWGISISGNASSASSLSGFTNSNSGNPIAGADTQTNNGIGYVTSISLLGQTDGALYTQAYSSSWVHQVYGDYRTGQIAIRGKNSGTWQAWRTVLDSSNYTSYSPSLTGSGASGSWGISVTGSAATLTTTRTLWGQSFNGSANVTGALSSVTTLAMSGQLTNTVAVGTAPFVITSTTRVANLNVATAGTADTLTTARTINGVSFNGSANITIADSTKLATTGGTLTGALTIQTIAPILNFIETDQTSPAGRRRLVLDGNGFTLRRNTAAAGDFTTEVNDFSVDAASNFVATGNVTAYSDESLKKDWTPVAADFIERLATLKSGTYTRIDSGERQAGSSAQDWKRLLPEVVQTSADGILSLAYGNAALVSAIELAKDNRELRARIERLEALVEKLIGD